MEPLASIIRPKSLDEFVGQKHLVGNDKPLKVAIDKNHLFSFIFWGPPGVGKTTLAKIYAKSLDAELFELSAVSAGKADIRKIVDSHQTSSQAELVSASSDDRSRIKSGMTNTPKILFLDEIHRFNKAQQDFLLPYVESGELTLIGATTENPSFEVISPLLSRCRVFILNELTSDEMSQVIDLTGIKMDTKARDWLISMANGDARQAITMLEATQKLYKQVTIESLKNTLQSKHLRFDKKGEDHYNTVSAFIKSMRASQADAAIYYLARMIDSGEDPKFIARRMVVFASEDIGNAVPTALVVANEVFRAVETIGYPECRINLAQGVIYLCNAKKDRTAYNAIEKALADVKKHGNLSIPMSLRNPVTKLMKDEGYGKGYESYTKESLLPEKLKNKKYANGG